jgi:uncharacterized protein
MDVVNLRAAAATLRLSAMNSLSRDCAAERGKARRFVETLQNRCGSRSIDRCSGTGPRAQGGDALEQQIVFDSDDLQLTGAIRAPERAQPGRKLPAFIVLHGFGSSSSAGNVTTPCAMLDRLGYVTMRFDFRGCGKSQGERGRIICLEQVADVKNAITALQSHPQVEADRIGLLGSSFGAAVAVYSAGSDDRVAACVSASGWGNGATKFAAQHGDRFPKFLDMLTTGKAYRQRTGQSMMVSRYEIVPIPEKLRGHVVEGSVMEMPVDTAQSMYEFRAEDMIGKISPRPTLLLHSAVDSVTPTEQTIEMFKRSGSNCEMHLFTGTDHFMFAEGNNRVHEVVKSWLEEFFPA